MNNQTGLEAHLTETSLLHRMINRIRQSLELEDILSATVAEMRSFLQTDRVKIYRFEEDGTGVVIAESIYKDRLPSLKNLHFPAGDIPPHAREMFVKARQRNIVNVASQLNIARTAAEEANRLKSDFLSSTSHELRTPLASTLNYLKLLKEGFYDDEDELQEYV